jgi:hypothetical protein
MSDWTYTEDMQRLVKVLAFGSYAHLALLVPRATWSNYARTPREWDFVFKKENLSKKDWKRVLAHKRTAKIVEILSEPLMFKPDEVVKFRVVIESMPRVRLFDICPDNQSKEFVPYIERRCDRKLWTTAIILQPLTILETLNKRNRYYYLKPIDEDICFAVEEYCIKKI